MRFIVIADTKLSLMKVPGDRGTEAEMQLKIVGKA